MIQLTYCLVFSWEAEQISINQLHIVSSLLKIHLRSLFFLISDLEEGGNRAAFLRKMEDLKSSGVTVVSLLALADGGQAIL